MTLWCSKLVFKYKTIPSPDSSPIDYKVVQTPCIIINILRCQLAIPVFIFQVIYMALYKEFTMSHAQKSTVIPWYQVCASHTTLLHSLSAFISLSCKLQSDRQTTSSMCTQDALYYAHSWVTQSKRTLDKVHKVLTSKRSSIHSCLKRSPFSLAKRPMSIDNFMHKQMANLCHINMY